MPQRAAEVSMRISLPRATIRGMAAHIHNQQQVMDHEQEKRLAPAAVVQLSALAALATLVPSVEKIDCKPEPCLATRVPSAQTVPVGFRDRGVPRPIVALSLPCLAARDDHVLGRWLRRVREIGWAIGIKRRNHAQV